MNEDQVVKIHELLQDFDTAMLVTHRPDQNPHARPMAIAKVERDCRLWFFTGRGTTKVHEIENDQHVLITCQDEHSRYVTLSGVAELVADRSKARDLWKQSFKTWFPKGVDDPDLLLILVHPTEAEYWDTQGLKGVRYMFEAAKAYATGARPRIREGEQHGKTLF